jgi:hypothetical protein
LLIHLRKGGYRAFAAAPEAAEAAAQ